MEGLFSTSHQMKEKIRHTTPKVGQHRMAPDPATRQRTWTIFIGANFNPLVPMLFSDRRKIKDLLCIKPCHATDEPAYAMPHSSFQGIAE